MCVCVYVCVYVCSESHQSARGSQERRDGVCGDERDGEAGPEAGNDRESRLTH